MGYDQLRGNPAWVAYRVFAVDEYTTYPRRNYFLIDDRTENRTSHSTYTNSGYDRGHMAPNFAIGTRFGQEAQRETFLMTNIVPQRPELNRIWWAKIERLIAVDYSETYDQVWVILGPVYEDTGNWIQRVIKIPTGFFMMIMVEDTGKLKILTFLEGQDTEPARTTVRRVEKKTGLNFNPLFEEAFADSIENN